MNLASLTAGHLVPKPALAAASSPPRPLLITKPSRLERAKLEAADKGIALQELLDQRRAKAAEDMRLHATARAQGISVKKLRRRLNMGQPVTRTPIGAAGREGQGSEAREAPAGATACSSTHVFSRPAASSGQGLSMATRFSATCASNGGTPAVVIRTTTAAWSNAEMCLTVADAASLGSRLLNLCAVARYRSPPAGDVSPRPSPVPVPSVKLRLNGQADDPSEAVELRSDAATFYLSLADAQHLGLQLRQVTSRQ